MGWLDADNYNRVTVEIGGQRLAFSTSNDPDYVVFLANYVDEKIRALAEKNPRLSISRWVLLVAINLAMKYTTPNRGQPKRGKFMSWMDILLVIILVLSALTG